MSISLKSVRNIITPRLDGISDPALAQALNDFAKVITQMGQKTYDDLTAISTTAYVDSIYLGSPNTNGSWRIIVSGSDLLIQRLIAGIWTTKSTVAG
jgi:hypothetical protein